MPDYCKVIKKPMDMTTVRRKLEGGEYADAKGFYNDVQLIIRNCMTFNPAGSPVRACGEKLAHVV